MVCLLLSMRSKCRAASVLGYLQGAQLVFERFIVPFLKNYASQLDPAFNSIDQAGHVMSTTADRPAPHV